MKKKKKEKKNPYQSLFQRKKKERKITRERDKEI
jgi:hypothetical protein